MDAPVEVEAGDAGGRRRDTRGRVGYADEYCEQLDWPVVTTVQRPAPEREPQDLEACLAGPNGLDLVVELAHDLRSPLTSILFLAEALQQGQGGSVTPEQARQLGLIYSAALCLCATASDVLELARGGNRLVDRSPAPFSVADTFASVRSMVLPIAEEKGLAVRLVHPVPERRVGQARALSRVLLNLATNAVKFTDTGYVEVAARPIGTKRLEFSVRDTGAGIDPALLAPCTSRCGRCRRTGVTISRAPAWASRFAAKLATAMGTVLQVETRPNWGTRFYFEVDCPPASSAS